MNNDIRPLKGPVDITDTFSIWPLLLLAVVLVIIGVLVFLYLRKKRRITEEKILPPRPPEEIALENLKRLLEMKLPEKGLVKEFYIRLTDIIRSYIGARFEISALDMTTWELYLEMRAKRIERSHVDKIRDFLEGCDLVKFAKVVPSAKEIEEAYRRAEEIIRH